MPFEITCPHCGRTFEEDESKFASIVQQVHDAEFERSLAAQVKLVEDAHASQVEAAVAKALAEARDAEAAKDAQIAELRAQLSAAAQQSELQQAQSLAAKDAETAQALAAKDAELAELRAQLAAQQNAAAASTELALTKAAAEAERAQAEALRSVERERDEATHQVELVRLESERAAAQAAERLAAEQQRASEQLAAERQRAQERLAERDEEIARIRDMRARLNTKLIGESLEQHCEIEYEKLRPLFGGAEFHKDNEAVEGTKGDYIFRDFTPEGMEYISIMFEMKNEEEGATHHKKNADHLRKLDADRRKKGCEYAVLVSLLEPENELYNQGIVDVSHEYEKMYVIRPQFFIPLITLLRNAARSQLGILAELEQARAESIDITNFEEALDAFKADFSGTTERAGKKFAEAIANIDKAIADLEKVKAAFQLTEKHLNAANNKADRLTIRRLTREAPLLRERFAELAEERAAAAELPAEHATASLPAGEPVEPDAVE